MKIIAGAVEVPIFDMPYAATMPVDGKMRDCYRLILDGLISEEQLTALKNNDWQLFDGESVIETISGYDTLINHEIIFAKIQTKQQEIDAALKPVLEVLNDEQAAEFTSLYPEWISGKLYAVGTRTKYSDILYKCITEHTSQSDWTPDVSPSLWTKVLVSEDGEILAWVQPDSTNTYTKGDKVTHNGKTWVSVVDNNSWEPGVYGWDEVI